jgi:hypothetical protein
MGTNYYLKGKPACEHCRRGPERGLHIGKSSAGWVFALRVYPHGQDDWRVSDFDTSIKRLESLEDWLPLFARFGVIDEYDRDVTTAEMHDTIANRAPWKPGVPLRRSEIDGRDCIGRGPGTWDLCVGEFS